MRRLLPRLVLAELLAHHVADLPDRRVRLHRVDDALAALRDACRGDANVMPHIVDAVKAYATVGEICDVMREEFGEYKPGQ